MTRISGYEFVINLDARQAINSINTFNNRVKVMKRVMEANFSELSRSVGSLSAYGQRIHDLSRQEEEAMLEVDKLRDKLANQRAEQERLRKEFQNGTKAQDQYRAGSDKLDSQIASTQRRIANVLIRIEAINKDMEESRQHILRLSTGVDALREHNVGLQKSYTSLEESLRKSGNLYRANRTHVEGLQQTVKGLSKQVKAESMLLDQNREHHAELTEQFKKQSATVDRLTAKKAKNGKLTKAENAELTEAKGKVQGLTERIGASSKAIGEQSEQLYKTTQALKDAKKAASSFSSTKIGSFFSAAGSKMDIFKNNSEHMRNWASSAKSTAMVVGGALASVGTGAGVLIKKASEVQNKFIEVRNLMETAGEGSAKSIRNMNKMMSQAVTLSTKYGISQKEIGEQYEELIKRGYSGTAALGSMNSMLKASKASGDEFSDVVRVSSTVLDSFNLRAENAAKMAANSKRVNNAIASAADRTSTSFKDLGTGLAYVSGTAHNVGYSVEETAAALGELANRGLDGTRAGTGLRKVLTSLTGPTKYAASAFKSIGLSTKDFTDQKGNLLSIDEIFRKINSHLSGKSGTEKAKFYKTVFGATGMEAAQDLAKTAGEVAHNDQNITTLIKHIREDETGDYITRLAKKNMQSTKNQMAVLKETLWATGIMIGKELLPTVNKVARSLGKWTVSKEGKQTIHDVADMVSGLLTGITKRSGSILKFLEGAVTGVKDIGKVTKVIFSPVVKLFDMMSGKKGGGAEWMGRIAGWFIAGAGAVKLFNALFGWTIAGFRDFRAMAKNGLFGSKLTTEQTQLMGVNSELKTTNDLLSQIQQKQIDVLNYAQQVADATAYKSEHGPLGQKSPAGVEDANSDLPIINYEKGGKTAEKVTYGVKNAGKETSVIPYAREEGKAIAEEVSAGAAESGAVKQAGSKLAQEMGAAVEKSGGLAKGVEGAAEGVVKSRGLWAKGLAIGGKILGGLNYAFLAFDMSKSIIEMLTSSSKKVRQSSAWKIMGMLVGGGIGGFVGGPTGAVIGATLGEGAGWGLSKIVPKFNQKQSKQTKFNRAAGMGIGTIAGLALGVPFGPLGPAVGAGLGAMLGNGIGGMIPTKQTKAKRKHSILDASQTKAAEGLANTIKKLRTKNIELKVGVNSNSIKKTGAALDNMYRSMQKSADRASIARMKSEKKALDFALKSGLINKKQYGKAIQDIEKADTNRQKNNKKVTDKLVQDTKTETRERAKAYDQYYKEVKKKGVSQEFAENNLKNKLREIDSKYAASRKRNEKSLTEALEKTWNTSNNKQLSKMKSIVRQKGKLSEKEAGQLIKDSAKTANNTIKNANKQHDKTVQSAKDEYKGRVSALKHLRDDSKTISESQYKALKRKALDEKKAKIDAADAARRGVVKQAKDQHDKTIEYAEKQSKGVSKHIVSQGNNSIDSYNAQAVNATGVTKSILDAWNAVLKFFGQKPIPIAKTTPKKSPHISANSYATGGVARNGLALVGEAGPELVYTPYADNVRVVGVGGAEFTHLKAGEQVLNARDTKRLMGGSYSGVLPGYAKGTSALSSWLNNIKKASDKVLKKIPKSIKNMLKSPVEWVNKLFSTKWDAPKTAYPFAKINEMVKLKDMFKKNTTNFIKGIFKKAYKALIDAEEGAFTKGSLSGSQAQRARQLAKIMRSVYPAATKAGIAAIIGNWVFESGLNSAAVNPSGGASGLGQWLGGRKANLVAYAKKHGTSWTNAGTQVSFALNAEGSDSAIFKRILGGHGSVASLANAFSSQWERGGYNQQHVDGALRVAKALGYANGGLVTREQLAHVAEDNNPEMIIPLSPLKRPRATQLTQQVVDKFNAESSRGVQHVNTNVEDKLDILINQFTTVLGQLKQVIKNQDNPVPAIMGTAQAYSALNKYKKNQELKTKMLY
ncbi:phage tail tape measure protein [Lactobacillus delbrueckii subsp. lactis]|jgi:TP901 family phage tail tape measure protein|uniref:phage tail tape measure protein n=2 Tax=Lactobacillus delbrueckii TaxID=1584 RepID=UPI0002DFCA9D|nr:phage tail tape measure protein [Lactobacillus delbrueckii]MBO3081462.1 phage tail tape measure protein [Lactobacillus delbrueckii subsp. bulgaricus]MCD5438092.1 phage tail tape measure protein [Lactobacillus delbrueckii subsp. lactis]MCD5468609.1 phage tail tape measure protein [Lactobacillus delbrueckii subsp. lactis]MCZ0795609.1 phage tail tape measure protein [Lactobacillus delbrueckii subsp. lactis]MDK8159302.1 phage tail tape measure protein [Lactobacillus delbrueckii]